MAVVSTSLGSAAASTQLSTHSSGLRKSVLKLDNSNSTSRDSLLQDSHIRLVCCRGVVMMAGSGKNGTSESISKLVSDINTATLESDVGCVWFWRISNPLAPPFVYIVQVKNTLSDRVEIAAQNCWIGEGGAFTGEISAEQINDLGCTWVVLGHSEQRHVIGEDNEVRANGRSFNFVILIKSEKMKGVHRVKVHHF